MTRHAGVRATDRHPTATQDPDGAAIRKNSVRVFIG